MSSGVACSSPRPALPRWPALAALLAAEALALTLRFDTDTLRGQPGLWSAALAAGLAAWSAGLLAGLLAPPLQRSTYALVRAILDVTATEVLAEPGRFVIGTPAFAVHVAPECSGYEGLGLVCVFLAV